MNRFIRDFPLFTSTIFLFLEILLISKSGGCLVRGIRWMANNLHCYRANQKMCLSGYLALFLFAVSGLAIQGNLYFVCGVFVLVSMFLVVICSATIYYDKINHAKSLNQVNIDDSVCIEGEKAKD